MSKRATQHSSYFLRIGAEYLNKTVIPDSKYQVTLSKTTSTITRSAFMHFMYDESGTIDGGRIAIGLLKNSTQLESAESCEFTIYKVSNDATPWLDTQVKTGTLVIGADKLFKTTLDTTEAGVDIQGDVTFKIKAKLVYKNKPYYLSQYFNHVGITDKVERLRKKVVFLDLTKKSTGEP